MRAVGEEGPKRLGDVGLGLYRATASGSRSSRALRSKVLAVNAQRALHTQKKEVSAEIRMN